MTTYELYALNETRVGETERGQDEMSEWNALNVKKHLKISADDCFYVVSKATEAGVGEQSVLCDVKRKV